MSNIFQLKTNKQMKKKKKTASQNKYISNVVIKEDSSITGW